MKQDTNNPPSASPVDDLFARRLGQHSVVPDKAVWERLQSKMAGKQEVRVLAFWQNPVVHRYAAAACVSALLLAGGWLLLRPTAGTTTRQNQMVMSGSETDGSMADSQTVIKQNRKPQSRYEADLATGLQPKQTDFSDLKEQATPTAKNGPLVKQKQFEISVARMKSTKKEPVLSQPEIAQKPADQLAKAETKPAMGSAITALTKPVVEQALIVTITEPDALLEARQAANWSESAEKTLVVDVSAKPARNNGLLQQLKRVREGNSLELAGDADQSLLSRAFQTIKNKTNNKPLKQ